ncbi:PQQ-like beta-propeller repeat protein [candidate division KSB1 bacterium]|nr:PQQ-like beta-propeller repeat protein [candidate division KSB1 bacterium]
MKRKITTLGFILRLVFILSILLVSRSVFGQDWLQWGGPAGDFKVKTTGLADKWPADGPGHLWKRPLGEGYSSILYKDGQLFTMYGEDKSEVVISLNAQTGATNWEHRYSREFWPERRQYFGPGPNASPIIVDDRIISIGIAGQMRCLELATGKLLWVRDLPTEFGRRQRVEEYGYSNSPLPYGDTIIVQVGGDDQSVIAVDPKDGSTVWQGGPGGVSYAQASIIKLAGQDQFIYFSPEGVNGLDPSTGKFLWHYEIPFDNGNHLTPIVKCDESRIWVSSQFNSGGGRLLEITRKENRMDVKQIWFESKLRGSCWTLIRIGDFIYGSAGGHDVSFLTAFNWRTEEIAWQRRGFHMAQCLYADHKLLFLDKSGNLSIAKISPAGVEVLDSAQVTQSVSWTLPTLVSTKLYVRDKKHILALELGRIQSNGKIN